MATGTGSSYNGINGFANGGKCISKSKPDLFKMNGAIPKQKPSAPKRRQSLTRKALALSTPFCDIGFHWIKNVGSLPCIAKNWKEMAARLDLNHKDQQQIELRAQSCNQEPGLLMLQRWAEREGAVIRVLIDVAKQMGLKPVVMLLETAMKAEFHLYVLCWGKDGDVIEEFTVVTVPKLPLQIAMAPFLDNHGYAIEHIFIVSPRKNRSAHPTTWDTHCGALKGVQLEIAEVGYKLPNRGEDDDPRFYHSPGGDTVPDAAHPTTQMAPTIIFHIEGNLRIGDTSQIIYGARSSPYQSDSEGEYSDDECLESDGPADDLDETCVKLRMDDCRPTQHRQHRPPISPLYEKPEPASISPLYEKPEPASIARSITEPDFGRAVQRSNTSSSARKIFLPKSVVENAQSLVGFHDYLQSAASNIWIYKILQRYINRDGFYILWQWDEYAMALSITFLQKIRHYKVRYSPLGLYFHTAGPIKPNLSELIEYYKHHDLPLPLKSARNSADIADPVSPSSPSQYNQGAPPLPSRPEGGFLRLIKGINMNLEIRRQLLADAT